MGYRFMFGTVLITNVRFESIEWKKTGFHLSIFILFGAIEPGCLTVFCLLRNTMTNKNYYYIEIVDLKGILDIYYAKNKVNSIADFRVKDNYLTHEV